jgi:DNA-binding IclR family transcriptional regulator
VHELLATLVAREYLQEDEVTGTFRLDPEDHWVELVRDGTAHFSALLGFSA